MAGGTGLAYSVAQTEIGLAIETTRGTQATAPAYMIPVKDPKYKINQASIDDDTLQGNMAKVQNVIRGLRYDGHGWTASPYLDSFPLFIAGELGSPDTVTIAGTPTTTSVAAAVGATAITTTTALAVGDVIVIGTAPTLETHIVLSVATDVATLTTPLIYAQPSGTTVTPLTQHLWSLLNNSTNPGNQPPSMTIWDNDGEEWRILLASQLDELNIKGNGTGLLQYTCTFFGNPAIQNATAPTVSYTSTQTPAPWAFSLFLNGVAVGTIVDWEIDFKRGVKPTPALTGSQEYYNYFAGQMECTGKFTLVELSSSPYLASFVNGTQQSLELSIFDVVSGDIMVISSAKAQLTSGSIDRSKEVVEIPIDVQFLPTASNATAGGKSPIQVMIANNVTTAYNS